MYYRLFTLAQKCSWHTVENTGPTILHRPLFAQHNVQKANHDQFLLRHDAWCSTSLPLQFIGTLRSPVTEFSLVFNADEPGMWTVIRQPVLHQTHNGTTRKQTRSHWYGDNCKSLELRRMHLDLLYCYSIVFGLVNVNFGDFFALSTNTNTRGHKNKLFKPRCTDKSFSLTE